MHHRIGALENTRQRVVILGRNRVKLVVMTPRTTERHTHERTSHRVNLLIDHVNGQSFLVLLFIIGRAQCKKSGSHNLFIALLARFGR